ncbi:NAD-dependent epimerase/dehydratase family protein [Nocardia farcinica]|uniref:UDP-glucose 4-epimerase n=1 Tax=Nocardia farcinica TaxID=37329 RepID=A0A0H5PHH0_NOCFR|nr:MULTISPECIES: NAD-dependent epimerase/dehydratase family protein [Nocardia]AXK87563.1 NAD-dependent epimerase/dehydratase family protein [Nocardia farcinica]MBA4858857.1 NAD-dependent epimerase/dehydratase family protein [Nocardia farcinica]MBC9816851.1 NAD-dependent epimerase/dehydratase family protein [Nocardia farcinica]MBF6071078.1 NAD-dependent epimerase/dehydratase family protein [Nocardia farcinica]MBF6141157.1 NAD-dependent epimerase/dehydratase family protein [Nocardia farcinica]
MGSEARDAHAPKVVLVTGASRFFGGHVVAELAQDPAVERIIAVDTMTPGRELQRRMGRAEFVRADIRNPLIRKVIGGNEVDTVVHTAVLSRPPSPGGRAVMKDLNVLGAMQLFAVCQKTPSVRRVVVRSSSAVYGCSPKDPAKFTEEMSARKPPSGWFARDMIEIEGFVRGMARRRPDIGAAILRLAPTVGPRLARRGVQYLRWPVAPTVFGRDARMQLLHEQDAVAALAHAARTARGGTYNVAGDGALTLSQAVRRSGRLELPLPFAVFRTAGRALMETVMRDFSAEQLDYFHFGCGLDTTRMRTELGFEPRWTTVQAFDDFIGGAALRPVIDPRWIDAAEHKLLGLLGAGTGAHT